MKEINTSYLGYPIRFTVGQCIYMKMLKECSAKAEEIQAAYAKDDPCKSVVDFMQTGYKRGLDLISPVSKFAVNFLASNGIYELDSVSFSRRYKVLDGWYELKDKCREILDDADSFEQSARDTRELRKDSRGCVIGGGFGLQGAIHGMVAAGVMNAASGALHSGANLIGNIRTHLKTQKALEALYQSEDFQTVMLQTLGACIYFVGTGTVCAMGFDLDEVSYPTSEKEQEAKTLMRNYHMVPEKDRKQVCAQILSCDPTNADVYQFLLDQHQDPDGTLGEIAGTLGIRSYTGLMQKNLQQSCLQPINTLDRDLSKLSLPDYEGGTSDRVFQAYVSNICDCCSRFGITPDDALTCEYLSQGKEKLQSRLEELQERDRQSRTYNGTLYDTYDERKKAQSIWERVEDLTKDCDAQSTTRIREIKDEVLQATETAPDLLKPQVKKWIEQLDQAWTKAEVEERTFLGVTFPTRQKRETAEQQWNELDAAQEKAAKSASKSARKSERLALSLSALKNDSIQLDPALADKRNKWIAELEAQQKQIEREERTFQEHEFRSFDACEKAKKDYEQLFNAHPYDSITTWEQVKEIDQLLEHGGLDDFIVSLYKPKFQEIAKQVAKANTRKVRIGIGITALIINLLALLFVPMLELYGTTYSTIGMIGIVVNGGGEKTVPAMVLVFVIGVLIVFAIKEIDWDGGSKTLAKDIKSYLFAVGGVLLLVLAIGCGLIGGQNLNSSLVFKLLAAADFLMGLLL